LTIVRVRPARSSAAALAATTTIEPVVILSTTGIDAVDRIAVHVGIEVLVAALKADRVFRRPPSDFR